MTPRSERPATELPSTESGSTASASTVGGASVSDTGVHVSDTVVAKVAAYYARRVPGVAALQPDLAQSVVGLAGRVFGGRHGTSTELSTDGVDVEIVPGAAGGPAEAGPEVGGPTARIEITVVTRLGFNCRTVAETIQHEVATHVLANTGIPATVTVTITDIDLSGDLAAVVDPDQPPLRGVPG